jgi:glutamate dehydrogenase/leucine dehydrogenase
VAGAANDVLDSLGCDSALSDLGIVYVPDFLINAGGVIDIHARRAGWDEQRALDEVMAIGARVHHVLDAASADGGTPLHAAEELASDRLGHSVRLFGHPWNHCASPAALSSAVVARTPGTPSTNQGKTTTALEHVFV